MSVNDFSIFGSFSIAVMRKILQATTPGGIAGVARATPKLGLRYYKISDAWIVQRIGFCNPEAVAKHGIVGYLLRPYLGSKLRLQDNRVVIPKIDDVAIRVIAEKVTPAFAVPLPRMLYVMSNGSFRDFHIFNSISRTPMLIRVDSRAFGRRAAIGHIVLPLNF